MKLLKKVTLPVFLMCMLLIVGCGSGQDAKKQDSAVDTASSAVKSTSDSAADSTVSSTVDSATDSTKDSAVASASQKGEKTTYPLVIKDQAGREVTIDKKPQTIVSCYYLVTSSLIALGQKDKVKGVENDTDKRMIYKLCTPEYLDLPEVGSKKEINIETIASISPDVIFLPKKQKDAAETLDELGFKTIVVFPETYDDFNQFLLMLGEVCDCSDEAKGLVSYYDDTVKRVKDLTADIADKPSVYLSGAASYLTSCSGGMYQREMIEIAGGKCVSDEINDTDWTEISTEQLAKWNPEYMFPVQYAQYSVDDICNDSALSNVKAVIDKKIFSVPSEIEAWDYPQPSSILGILWMTHILHPDLMTEEEYLKDAQDFYSVYYGIEVTKEQLGL